MANVQHPDFVPLDRPENEIRISPDRYTADRADRGGMADAGIMTDRVDCALDSKPDAERAARATLVKIVEDLR
jgi:hypothetical protein